MLLLRFVGSPGGASAGVFHSFAVDPRLRSEMRRTLLVTFMSGMSSYNRHDEGCIRSLLEQTIRKQKAEGIDVDADSGEDTPTRWEAIPKSKRRYQREPIPPPPALGDIGGRGFPIKNCGASTMARVVWSAGELLFRGLDRCPWHRSVLPMLAGIFEGERLVKCIPSEANWNMRVLAPGRSLFFWG